jgi:hypothetical protein
VGKSRLAALLILWWLFTRRGSLVLVTAPSANLIGSVVFKELRKAKNGTIFPLGGNMTQSWKASPQCYDLGPGWGCLGISVDSAVNAHGQHNAQLPVIVDESSGVERAIWESVTSWNYPKMVLFGNCVGSEGEFVNHFNRSKRPEKKLLPPEKRTVSRVISALESRHIHLSGVRSGLGGQIRETVFHPMTSDARHWKRRVVSQPPRVRIPPSPLVSAAMAGSCVALLTVSPRLFSRLKRSGLIGGLKSAGRT